MHYAKHLSLIDYTFTYLQHQYVLPGFKISLLMSTVLKMFKFCHVVELWITIKLKVCKMVRGILHIENTFNTIKASNLYCMSITIPLDLELYDYLSR